MNCRLATLDDMDGVKKLLKKYHKDTISEEDRSDGFVTTAITDEQLTSLILEEHGVTIITDDETDSKVLGFCFAAPWDFWESWPLFRHMMDIIPDYSFEGNPLVLSETYQYGPMCVDRSIRGTGAFEKLFFTSLAQWKEQFPVMLTFVNQINKRSENAHNNKAGMETVGTFDFNDNHYFLMAIRTDAGQIMENKYKLLDQVLTYSKEYLDGVEHMPAWPSSEAIADLETLRTPLPEAESDPAEVIALLNKYAAPATTGSMGGHFYGFVNGGLLPVAHAAQWLIDTWNQNTAMYAMSPAASILEDIAEKWVAELFGFPEGTAMSLVTGSSNGILVSLIAARNELLRRRGWDVRKQGYKNAPPIRIVLSAGAHGAVLGALYYLGFGTDELEFVPVDKYGRMIPEKVPPLDTHTLFILQAGHICGGAYDPIETLVEMGNKAGAWVHVDGAFGLWAAVTPKQSHYVKGLEKADSCNVDAHKTLNAGYDNSIVLCRDRKALQSAMAVGGSYLTFSERRDGSTYATEMSRRARGIVLWAVLRQLGKRGVAALMDHLCDCTEYFAAKMAEAGFQVPNPPFFNQFFVKCDTEEHTKAVLEKIQASGKAWSGSAVWEGETVMRMSVCSYMITHQSIDESVMVYRAAYDEIKGCGSGE